MIRSIDFRFGIIGTSIERRSHYLERLGLPALWDRDSVNISQL